MTTPANEHIGGSQQFEQAGDLPKAQLARMQRDERREQRRQEVNQSLPPPPGYHDYDGRSSIDPHPREHRVQVRNPESREFQLIRHLFSGPVGAELIAIWEGGLARRMEGHDLNPNRMMYNAGGDDAIRRVIAIATTKEHEQ